MSKAMKVGGIIVVLIILFVCTMWAMQYVAYTQIYSHLVDSVSNLTGLNTYLAKAIMALMIIPLVWGIKLFLSMDGKRSKMGAGLIVIFILVYNLSLYVVTKNMNFNFSDGKSAKWYALTPEGVKFFDKSGVDPVYGIPLKPVTADVIRNLKLLQKGDFKPLDPKHIQFFNPITGDAQVWYYQLPDGTNEFYDKPGYNPVSGEPLKIVTKQVYSEWQENEKVKKKEQEKNRLQQAEEEEKKREELRKRIADEESKRGFQTATSASNSKTVYPAQPDNPNNIEPVSGQWLRSDGARKSSMIFSYNRGNITITAGGFTASGRRVSPAVFKGNFSVKGKGGTNSGSCEMNFNSTTNGEMVLIDRRGKTLQYTITALNQ